MLLDQDQLHFMELQPANTEETKKLERGKRKIIKESSLDSSCMQTDWISFEQFSFSHFVREREREEEEEKP